MKTRIIYLTILLLFTLKGFTQESKNLYLIKEVTQAPVFKKGDENFYKYIGQNAIYPKELLGTGICGTVTIGAIIDTTGSISKTLVLYSIEPSLDKIVLRAVSSLSGSQWIPGEVDGKPVNVLIEIPITFGLSKSVVGDLSVPSGTSEREIRKLIKSRSTMEEVPPTSPKIINLPEAVAELYNQQTTLNIKDINDNDHPLKSQVLGAWVFSGYEALVELDTLKNKPDITEEEAKLIASEETPKDNTNGMISFSRTNRFSIIYGSAAQKGIYRLQDDQLFIEFDSNVVISKIKINDDSLQLISECDSSINSKGYKAYRKALYTRQKYQ